jgi:hypothetical protein
MKSRRWIPVLVTVVAAAALAFGVSFLKQGGSAVFAAKAGTYQSKLGYEITVDAPSNAKVASPLKVSGVVRGPWTYNGEFPVEIVDAHHRKLGAGHATVRGNWMTEKPVHFSVSMPFSPAKTSTGFLVIQKANPSLDRSMNDSVDVPITFAKS